MTKLIEVHEKHLMHWDCVPLPGAAYMFMIMTKIIFKHQSSFSLKRLGQSKPNSMWSVFAKWGGDKKYIKKMVLVTVICLTKMAAMHIHVQVYGKNH